jgi:hypothetical protein
MNLVKSDERPSQNGSQPLFPQGLKPLVILKNLRGPKGPLFNGDGDICEFFRKRESRALPKTDL